MPEDPITFQTLLTPAGVVVAAAIITSLVELLKRVINEAMPVSGATAAFVLSGVLYVLAGVAVGVGSLDAGLGVFLAWLSCATSAVGIYATTKHVAS